MQQLLLLHLSSLVCKVLEFIFLISFSAKSASVSDEAPDISNVPEEYHEFADVFSKAKANTSALHCPYDLKINLEEGASLPINPMYSLSQYELITLQEFINKHL